ncbi:immunoglobulin-like domain-containing protein [Listeria rustica]|uniref:DUF5011 domain-containing protein n=1 Tax=Listeria rustica TaxID=2713503 RepID=A0A7W1T761_9LIST|nr:immunoglobulin-like domain-containing protein [Listeria rustica]MBA3926750.1 DUF5011 domain-containing protein [Listeria rustica]
MTKRNVLKKTGVALLTTAVVSSQLIATVPYNVFAAENVQATQQVQATGSVNMIKNSDFSGSTNWTSWKSPNSKEASAQDASGVTFNGNGTVDIASFSSVQQTVTTIPGHKYKAVYSLGSAQGPGTQVNYYAAIRDGGIYDPHTGTKWGQSNELDRQAGAVSGQIYQLPFVAQSTQTTMSFTNSELEQGGPGTVNQVRVRDLVVLDVTDPSVVKKPTVDPVTSADTVITGTATPGVFVYAINQNSTGDLIPAFTKQQTVKVDATGHYEIKLPSTLVVGTQFAVVDGVNYVGSGPTEADYDDDGVSSSLDDNEMSAVQTVMTNEKPVISGAANKSIQAGTAFDVKAGVTATDKEDGNLTSAIKVTGTVNNNVAGTYPITYSVTDSAGNVTTKSITITVTSNEKPVISGAANKSIKAGTAFDAKAGVTATDKEDGSLTSAITVSGTVNSNVPGSYPITYTVKDSDGNTTTKSITITVTSNDKPVISGAANKTIDQGTAFNAKTGVTATDTEDGNLTSAITVSGSVNSNVPGTYPLTYSVKDSDGNTTTKSITITVKAAATQGTVTTNDFTINKDSYITGTYTGDVSKMSVIVNGKKLTTVNTSGSPFKYYAGRNVTGVNDVVEVVVYDATGKELDRSTVTVKKEINTQGTITANPFVIGKDGYVKGNLTGDVAKISMIVNGKEFSRIDKAAGAYQYYAGGKILTANDDVTMVAYDAQGKELSRANVAVSKDDAPEVGTITTNTFTIGKDGYVTGTFTGKAARVGLMINGTALSRIDVASSPFKYYVGSKIASTNDAVTAIIYDAKGREMARSNVKVEKAAPVTSGTIAANAFQVGGTDSYIHGTTTGDVVKVKMMVNGTTISQRAVNADGSYDYYARPSITSVNDDVYMVGFDATGKELSRVKVALTAAKGTVAASPFTVGGADKYLHGTATGDVVKVQVFINGTLDSLAVVKADGTFQYYLNNKVTSTNDKLEIVGLSNNGQELDRQAVTLN